MCGTSGSPEDSPFDGAHNRAVLLVASAALADILPVHYSRLETTELGETGLDQPPNLPPRWGFLAAMLQMLRCSPSNFLGG